MVDGKKGVSIYSETRLKHLLFSHPVIKLLVLIVLNYALNIVATYYPNNLLLRFAATLVNINIAVFFVLTIIYVVHRKWKHLMNPKNVFALLGAYAFFVVIIILIFSTIFSVVELSGLGYLKYGGCSDVFEPEMISQDSLASHNFIYFSAITFFTVGYGDICPMGTMKLVAILTAFVGHLVTVIVVALIVNNYIRTKENNK